MAMRHFIRLTISHPTVSGAVCHRIPTTFRDWRVDLELNSWGGRGGRGIWFLFSSDFCPNPRHDVDGLSLFISTLIDSEANMHSPVTVNDANRLSPLCHVALRSDERNLHLTVSRTDSQISISYLAVSGGWNENTECGTTRFDDLPLFGSFSVFAATEQFAADDHDLYSMRTFSLTRVLPILKRNFSKINTAVIEGKRFGKFREMNLTKKYLRNQTGDFNDSFRVIGESIRRSSKSISKPFLHDFINKSIVKKTDNAKKIIEAAARSFVAIKADLQAVWKDMRHTLKLLHGDVRAEAEDIRKEVLSIAEEFAREADKSAEHRAAVKDATGRSSESWLWVVFLGLVAVEMLMYLVFVCRHTVLLYPGLKKAE
jgi:hypothetical protein